MLCQIIGDAFWWAKRIAFLTHPVLRVRDAIYCTMHGIQWHWSWCLLGLPRIRRRPGASIEIGRRFVACSRISGNSLGLIQPVVLNALGRGSRIVIGDDVGISGCTISASLSITIGNRVMLGSGCMITDSDAHPLRPEDRSDDTKTGRAEVVIEDDVFVGTRAIILKGVRIGRGSVVGAGAVVVKSVPERVIVAGNPARVIRAL